jgi:hypothetical protein
MGPAHILPVGLTQGRNQSCFFDKYSIAITCPRASKKHQKPSPVSERQTKSGERDETASIGRMADVAIGSCFDDRLAGMKGYIVGEESPQNCHGVETKSHSGEHEADPEVENGGPVPKNVCLREEKRKRKVQSQRDPKKNHDEPEGTSVASP